MLPYIEEVLFVSLQPSPCRSALVFMCSSLRNSSPNLVLSSCILIYHVGPRPLPMTYCKQQANTEKELREELAPRPSIRGETKIAPLLGAAFSSNWVLFWRVYEAYYHLTGELWWREEVNPTVVQVALLSPHACRRLVLLSRMNIHRGYLRRLSSSIHDSKLARSRCALDAW